MIDSKEAKRQCSGESSIDCCWQCRRTGQNRNLKKEPYDDYMNVGLDKDYPKGKDVDGNPDIDGNPDVEEANKLC